LLLYLHFQEIALVYIRHDNSPSPGTEICVRHNQLNIAAVLQEAIAEINLTIDNLIRIYPE
jgi:hypothetical protein